MWVYILSNGLFFNPRKDEMNPKIKKEIKDWLELIALAAAGGIVVFHINGFFAPTTNTTQVPKPVQTTVTKNINNNDTIVQNIVKDTLQLKR